MSEPVLVRPTLKGIGLNTKQILAAAADRLHSEQDLLHMEQTNAENGIRGIVARVIDTGAFQSNRGIDEKTSGADRDWKHFGIDILEEKRDEVEKMLQ